jgi:hypothetical protein
MTVQAEYKTAPTAELLAGELDKLGLKEMAEKARQNHYHDFFSPLAAPAMALANDLMQAAVSASSPKEKKKILALRERHTRHGEFDASLDEANALLEDDDLPPKAA